MQRYWLFQVTDHDDEIEYIDAEGQHIDYSDINYYVGTDNEASNEGWRRVDLWEKRTGNLAARITLESRGEVKL